MNGDIGDQQWQFIFCLFVIQAKNTHFQGGYVVIIVHEGNMN